MSTRRDPKSWGAPVPSEGHWGGFCSVLHTHTSGWCPCLCPLLPAKLKTNAVPFSPLVNGKSDSGAP